MCGFCVEAGLSPRKRGRWGGDGFRRGSLVRLADCRLAGGDLRPARSLAAQISNLCYWAGLPRSLMHVGQGGGRGSRWREGRFLHRLLIQFAEQCEQVH